MMQSEIEWRYNDLTHQWEGEFHDFRAVIHFNANRQRYQAQIEPPDDSRPMKIEPRLFPDLEYARQWCCQVINKWLALDEQIAETLAGVR
jgi:hypothetical protein